MRFGGLLATALLGTAAMMGISTARAGTITFATAPFGYGFTGPVTEDGYTYSPLSGVPYVNDLGNPGQDMEGSAFGGGGTLKIVAAGGGSFTFSALDFAAFYGLGTGSQTLHVTGLFGGLSIGTDSYTLDNTDTDNSSGDLSNWTTETASVLAGQNIDELDIELDGAIDVLSSFASFEAVDNIVLGSAVVTTPEPASLALLGAGLAGIGAIRRRRRQ